MKRSRYHQETEKKESFSGLDGISAELLKAGPSQLSSQLAKALNLALSKNEDLELGLGLLTTLQKPGKPSGPVKNIRPKVLLPLLRKLISLMLLGT